MSHSSELTRLFEKGASDATIGRWVRENRETVIEAMIMDECTVCLPHLGTANLNERKSSSTPD